MFNNYHYVKHLQNTIFEKLPHSHFLITMDKNAPFEFCVKPCEPNIATCLIYWTLTYISCYWCHCSHVVCSVLYHLHFLKNQRFSWHRISPMSPWRSLLRSLVTTVICHTNLRIKHVLLKPILNVHFWLTKWTYFSYLTNLSLTQRYHDVQLLSLSQASPERHLWKATSFPLLDNDGQKCTFRVLCKAIRA